MNKKTVLMFILLILILISSAICYLLFGSSDISFSKMLSVLLNPGDYQTESIILWQIRFPRLLISIFMGAGLAVCGLIFQSVLRNPLASPYTLGVSGGSALGASLGIILGLAGLWLPVLAFCGGIFSMILIYSIASQKRFSNSALILTGVILSFTFSSLVILLFAISRSERVHSALLWLIGDLASVPTAMVTILPAIVIVGILILLYFGRDIDILTLGQEKAIHLGVSAQLTRKILFIIASFITAGCIAAAGMVSFVGLIIPHFIRYLFGFNHRRLIIASALSGAIFIIICDLLARIIIKPIELPVGVITGFFGGIFFLIFLIRTKKWEIT